MQCEDIINIHHNSVMKILDDKTKISILHLSKIFEELWGHAGHVLELEKNFCLPAFAN